MIVYLQMIDTPEDRSKFEQLYLEYRGLMFHAANQILHNEQDAEDAVHQAFLSIAQHIQNIDQPISSKTRCYVVTITENKAIDQYRRRFEKLARDADTRSCQYAFPAVYSLREKYDTELCITDNAVFLRSLSRTPGRVDYFAPLCPVDRFADALACIEQFATAEGRPYAFFGLTADQAAALETYAPRRYRITEDRDWAEYLYDVQPLATLEGSALKQKRKEARQCRNHLGDRLTVELLQAQHAKEVLSFQHKWLAAHDKTGEDASLAGENRAIEIAMAEYDALGLSGVIVRVDGEIAGYSYGCATGRDTYDILVQKAVAEVKFLYRVVFQESVRLCAQDFRYVNAEEDIGIAGLRALKLSYRPAFLLEKYRAEVIEA